MRAGGRVAGLGGWLVCGELAAGVWLRELTVRWPTLR